MSIKLYNSLSHKVEEFTPINKDKIGLYTCGPTVYNYAHIGNFRAYMFEDLLKRTLKYCGYNVYHIMNLTDVDDKTIRDSQIAKLPLTQFTDKFIKSFYQDVETLNIQKADVYPAATKHIGEMIKMIKILENKGIAYKAEDNSVYFSIEKFPQYGQLARINPDQLRPGQRVKNDEYAKESISDFALWKAYDPADGDVYWNSPWGKGRPGWHIECSAMAGKYLGKHFDIHCGGIDNLFPHHEDEIAQSEATNECKFVNYWLHCAHLIVDGEKMSKSKGNFFTLRQLLNKGYSGRILRWVLLGTHYRQSLNFSFKACSDAKISLQRLDNFSLALHNASQKQTTGIQLAKTIINNANQKFTNSLCDDLNISATLAALFDLVREGNKLLDKNKIAGEASQNILQLLRKFDTVLAVLNIDQQQTVPQEILDKANERQQARKNRDFALSDKIRDQLLEQGWIIEDTANGPRVKQI